MDPSAGGIVTRSQHGSTLFKRLPQLAELRPNATVFLTFKRTLPELMLNGGDGSARSCDEQVQVCES
jgi:hypothetical protein